MGNDLNLEFLDKLSAGIDQTIESHAGGGLDSDEARYLRSPAPNVCEWVNNVDYWNVPSTISDHKRQYQILRDVFAVRCPICNSMKPEDVDCWGKSRMYLESEVLLTWKEEAQDFVCPKCAYTQRELVKDGMFTPYNEMIILAGMRSGKSYLGAHIGGYFEHFLCTRAMHGSGYLQRWLKQEKAEWFEVTFAASTATQAAQTIYAKYREMRRNSPWIQRYMEWVVDFEKQQRSGDAWTYRMNDDAVLDGWAKVRYNRIASDSSGVAGKTRIAAGIDEWARLSDTEGTRSAKELYRVLNQSLKTIRAAVELNALPSFLGLMINVTSPIAQDDPAMETYNKAKDGELTRTYFWKGATWEFNPQMPRHIFDEEYVRDPVAAERDFAANPPNAESPFVDDPVRFWKSVDFERKAIATFNPVYLTDPTGKAYIASELSSCALDHTNQHYIFGDAGLTWDSFAMVCAHPEWIDARELEEELDEDGNPIPRAAIVAPALGRIEPQSAFDVVFAEDLGTFIGADIPVGADGPMIREAQMNRRRANEYSSVSQSRNQPFDHMGEILCTVIDFAIRIVPTRDRDIWFNSVVDIVQELQKKIRIAGVAFDHWNSESTIQQLRTMGILSTKVSLKTEHFMGFLRMCYNGRVKMLPPNEEAGDVLGITDTGALVIGTPQEEMHGQTVALVELLKLTRSPDLRRFFNPKKGTVRGKDSDDLARCYIGVHHLVQDSIVDSQANRKRRLDMRKKQLATDTSMIGQVFGGKGGW